MPFIPPAQKIRPKPLSKPKPKQDEILSQSQQEETISATQTETAGTTQKPSSAIKSQFTNSTGVEAMHELVTNLVSSIFYFRDIVPDYTFEDTLVQLEPTLHDDGSVKKPGSQLPIKLLKRDIMPEVNEIFGWLDFGLVDALRRKYLRSMMIIVYLSDENREKAIETYTMNFGYDGDMPFVELSDRMGQLSVSSREHSNNQKITKASFGKATRRMLREVYDAASRMPLLPQAVKFDFRLFYQDDTPEAQVYFIPVSYQPPAFEKDLPGEIYLATHGADEAPMTWECETTASTGHQGMSCQIASVAHFLPPRFDIDTKGMTNAEREQAERQALQDHRDETLDDENSRDIVWPVEKSIYGKVSATTFVESSQIESVQVEQATLAGFRYPLGQLLESGEIQAIEVGKKRWSDPIEGSRVWRNSSRPDRPTTMTEMLQVVQRRKSGYEGWSQPSQSQPATQVGGRELSLQQSSTQVDPVNNTASGADVNMEVDDDDTMNQQVHELPVTQQPDGLSGSDDPTRMSGSSQKSRGSRTSTSSTDITNPSSEDFDPIKRPEPAIPALAKRRASASSINSQTAAKAKSTKRNKSTTSITTAKKVSKPKVPKKKPETGNGTVIKPKAKPKPKPKAKAKAKAKPTQDRATGKSKKDSPPATLAQAQAQVQRPPMSGTPDPITTFTQESTNQTGRSPRHHPYQRSSSLVLSVTPDQSQQPSQSSQLQVPQTHFRRIRSSRGIRGLTYEEMMATLPTIDEGNA